MTRQNDQSVYQRVVNHVFSGDIEPGSKIVEQSLANELGVSRIPIRESLGKMVGQGLLVGERGGRGVRIRRYTVEEVRQLYEARGVIEGGIARAAAKAATDADIARLRAICDQSAAEIGNFGSDRWANLDHAFHEALADASHNERLANILKLMLTECHYVFYDSRHKRREAPSHDEAVQIMRSILEGEHLALLELVMSGDAEGAERKAQGDMLKHSQALMAKLVARELQ